MSRTRSHRVIPTDQFLAILNSNAATALNPFATIADVVAAAFTIPVVTNYTALPLPATAVNKYYNVANPQGTAWLPGSLGGTYYAKGIYYSDGLTWEYVGEFPFQADQPTVDGDTNNTEFVTALTLANYYKWNNKLDTATFDLQNQTTKEPTGFPNRVDTTFSFNDGTRTFTIQPIGLSFDFWTQGVRHTITTPKTLVLPNVTGKYFIYFDNLENLGQTITFDDSILNDKVFTAVVYYNANTGKGEFLLDERHGLTMDWATHFHLHNAFGTRYYGGFGLGYTLGDGSLDSHGQIALGSGTIADEDIPTTIVDAAVPSAFFEQVLSPIALIPAVYKLGAAVWQKDVATSYPYKTVAGIPQFNLDTFGVHTLEDVTDGNFFAVWIFALPEVNTPIVSILGGREDTTLNDAKNNNVYGTIDWGDLPSQEYKVLYRLIFQYDTTFTNTDKIALVEVDDLRGTIDAVLNSSTLNPVADHGNLIGLNDDDHLQYYNQTRGDARYSQLGHTHSLAQITDVTISTANLNSLDDGADSTLHFHASDRNRANHTGTQLASTISDFASTVLGTLLSGLSIATAQVVAPTDSILLAIGYLQAQVSLRVVANTAIVGATKTKITYDSKGLVTAGADATTADINDSTNRRYVTDAQAIVIGNTSGTNSGDQTSIVGISGTKAQFDTAVTDGNFLYVGDVVTSLKTKSGVIAAGAFAGNPKKVTVTFGAAFADANYSVSIVGIDARSWSIETVAAGSFVINANANLALTGNCYWVATKHGEN